MEQLLRGEKKHFFFLFSPTDVKCQKIASVCQSCFTRVLCSMGEQERCSQKTAAQTLMTLFYQQCFQTWVNKGKHFRSPQTPNSAVDLNKSQCVNLPAFCNCYLACVAICVPCQVCPTFHQVSKGVSVVQIHSCLRATIEENQPPVKWTILHQKNVQ